MERFFSIISTIFTYLLTGADFLGCQAARSAGLTRFRQFGAKRSKGKSYARSPFDSPFESARKPGFLDAPRGPGRIRGHSLGNATFGSGKGHGIIKDYSKLSAKADYQDSLTAQHQAASLSGFGGDTTYLRKPKRNLKQAPKLGRGQIVPCAQTVRTPHEFKPVKPLRREHGDTKPNTPALGGSGANTSAGRRLGNGPGGISHKSIRNFIKF